MTPRVALTIQTFLASLTLVLVSLQLVLPWQDTGVIARVPSVRAQLALNLNGGEAPATAGVAHMGNDSTSSLPPTLNALLDAINVLQDRYFEVGTGTWPDSIDWTAAVLGTHVSATLSTLVSSIDYTTAATTTCADALAWDDLVNRYFAHTSVFYFGENALSLRQQAYDDILWVVLGWLENIKLIDLYTCLRTKDSMLGRQAQAWHGTQFKPAAAHRARTFYNLAMHGWDTSLCGGGMVWSPYLEPYKNSVTNELFISASISMYLYFPGDDNDSPFLTGQGQCSGGKPQHPQHLANAIEAYGWLRSSQMKSADRGTPGLYADGFHISGWRRESSGHIHPGTGKCDNLNTMVYTYNQGVVLTGLRGLWLATGDDSYLDDGHELIEAVVEATGWHRQEDMGQWAGLGRGGVLEEYCDVSGTCSQNSHTFKGIFFHHLAEFCRPLWRTEEEFLSGFGAQTADRELRWQEHLTRCDGYRLWVKHNADAAAVTRDEKGRFGMWWGRSYPDSEDGAEEMDRPPLPLGAVDYQNDEGLNTEFGLWKQEEGLRAGATTRMPKADSRVQCHGLGTLPVDQGEEAQARRQDVNNRGRGRTVETQSGGVAVLRALWQWESVTAGKDREGKVKGK